MNKELIGSLAWAGGLLALGLGGTWARQAGYIDQDALTRLVMGAIGLMIAWYGNRMPKNFVPSASARKVARVGGWSMALSGLVYSLLWAFAPVDVAVAIGCGAVAAGIAGTIGYSIALRSNARSA